MLYYIYNMYLYMYENIYVYQLYSYYKQKLIYNFFVVEISFTKLLNKIIK